MKIERQVTVRLTTKEIGDIIKKYLKENDDIKVNSISFFSKEDSDVSVGSVVIQGEEVKK